MRTITNIQEMHIYTHLTKVCVDMIARHLAILQVNEIQ